MMAEQIRAARAMLKMEQSELADLANVSVATIRRLEAMSGSLDGVRLETLQSIESIFKQKNVWLIADHASIGVMMSLDTGYEDAVFEDLHLLFPQTKNWMRLHRKNLFEPDFEGRDWKDRTVLVQARILTDENRDYIIDAASDMKLESNEPDARYALVLQNFPFRLKTNDGIEIVPYDPNNRPEEKTITNAVLRRITKVRKAGIADD